MSNQITTVQVIQYLMPDGRTRFVKTDLPIEVQQDYNDMLASGCRFEIEMLQTGHVSATIFNPEKEEDVDISITSNGPDVQTGMVEMLKRRQWKEQ